jgi:hypothetical protein
MAKNKTKEKIIHLNSKEKSGIAILNANKV